MSTIDCSACNDLREYAPNFVQNGTNEEVCASLMNNTGLNPGLTVLHDNCEDLHDVNDCLIGRMTDELEAYDVCDWKDFMKKHNSNLYELLKAIICNDCGLWIKLCESVKGLFNLIRGAGAKWHYMTWTTLGKSKMFAGGDWDDSKWFMTIEAEIRAGIGCDTTKRINVVRPGWGSLQESEKYPLIFGFRVANLQVGDKVAYIRKSDLVPHDMAESVWVDLMRGGSAWSMFSIGGQTLCYMGVRGYIVIDGVEMNADLKTEFGPDVLVLSVTALVGNTTTGGAWDAQGQYRMYEV